MYVEKRRTSRTGLAHSYRMCYPKVGIIISCVSIASYYFLLLLASLDLRLVGRRRIFSRTWNSNGAPLSIELSFLDLEKKIGKLRLLCVSFHVDFSLTNWKYNCPSILVMRKTWN